MCIPSIASSIRAMLADMTAKVTRTPNVSAAALRPSTYWPVHGRTATAVVGTARRSGRWPPLRASSTVIGERGGGASPDR